MVTKIPDVNIINLTLFEKIDQGVPSTAGDGLIQQPEFLQYMVTNGVIANEATLMFNTMDQIRDGTLEISEFNESFVLNSIAPQIPEGIPQEKLSQFQGMDMEQLDAVIQTLEGNEEITAAQKDTLLLAKSEYEIKTVQMTDASDVQLANAKLAELRNFQNLIVKNGSDVAIFDMNQRYDMLAANDASGFNTKRGIKFTEAEYQNNANHLAAYRSSGVLQDNIYMTTTSVGSVVVTGDPALGYTDYKTEIETLKATINNSESTAEQKADAELQLEETLWARDQFVIERMDNDVQQADLKVMDQMFAILDQAAKKGGHDHKHNTIESQNLHIFNEEDIDALSDIGRVLFDTFIKRFDSVSPRTSGNWEITEADYEEVTGPLKKGENRQMKSDYYERFAPYGVEPFSVITTWWPE